MDDLITGLGSDFARWATQTEKYITQMLHKPHFGPGFQHLALPGSSGRHYYLQEVAQGSGGKSSMSASMWLTTGILQDIRHMLLDVQHYCSEDF